VGNAKTVGGEKKFEERKENATTVAGRETFGERKAKVKNAREKFRKKRLTEAIEQAMRGDDASRTEQAEAVRGSTSNRLSPLMSVEDERAEREQAAASQVQPLRARLEQALRNFGKIPDPRRPRSIKHKLNTLFLYGLLSCIFQMASRREANRDMSRPAFLAALQGLFPELETLPHADTLARLLARIDPADLEKVHIELLRSYIRDKKFRRYLINKCYPIAVDGTQKLVREGSLWGEEWPERHFDTKDGVKVQQYVYVLEANLVFHNGLTIPVLSEFLSHTETEPDDRKQDCELKAFKRLAERLNKHFPRLPAMILFDGLYANGPLISLCRKYNWQYMIVLQDKCLPSVWDKVQVPEEGGKRKEREWRGRRQQFYWVNHIDYTYDGNKNVVVHVVVCEESWQEVNAETGETEDKHSRHAWVSSKPLTKRNVHERCNLGARWRWGIENSMHTEKHRGYYYEHPYSYNWNAMRGHHCLMRMAHMFNALAEHTKQGARFIRELGIQAFRRFVRETMSGLWLKPEWMAELLTRPFQLRLE